MAGDQWEKMLTALVGRHRRQILVVLLEHDSQNGGGIDPFTAVTHPEGEAEPLQQKMVHNHLPKLEALEYIEWDREAGTVKRGAKWDEIAPLLTLIEDNRDELPGGWL